MRETAALPAEYRPDNALTRPTLGAVGEAVLGLILVAVTLVATAIAFYVDRDGDYGVELPIVVGLVFTTITVMYTATTVAERFAEPGIYVGDDSVVVGSYLWTDAKFYSAAGWVLCGGIWLAAGMAVLPGIRIIGYLLFALAAYEVAKVVYHGRRTRLVLDRNSFRAVLAGHDREFPWDAVSQVRGERVKVDKKTRTEIEFHCAPAHVVDHSGKTEPGFDSTEPRAYQILFTGLPVRPDALLATMEFMADHRDQRAGVALDQIAAMLNPPRHS